MEKRAKESSWKKVPHHLVLTDCTCVVALLCFQKVGFLVVFLPCPVSHLLSLSLAEVRCPAPPSIANGQHGASPGARHSPGSEVRYSCAEGYSLLGNASIRCTAKGTWSRPQPRCQGEFVWLPLPAPGLSPPPWLSV